MIEQACVATLIAQAMNIVSLHRYLFRVREVGVLLFSDGSNTEAWQTDFKFKGKGSVVKKGGW